MNGGRAHLACSLLILAALGATLALAGPGSPGAASVGEPPGLDPAELRRISVEALPDVADGVEAVRGLEFRDLPQPRVVTSAYLNRLGARELERQAGALGLAADEAFGRITGLLEPDDDLAAAYTSTGDLAAAAYDPRTGRLYVVSDAVAANRALVEFVLAHELDHALDDQRFGLRGGRRLDDDQALAVQALTEGTATAVMTDYAVRYLNPFELIAAAETIDEGTGDVPEVLVDQLVWTYIGGEQFVTELRDLAGSWKLVDFAFDERPPASTEQVLHPRKYVADERPAAVRINDAELRARGWHRAVRSILGELPTSLLLELGVDERVADAAAAGWGGDRYELWRREVAPGDCEHPCRAELILVARWRWDTAGDRIEFERAASDYVAHGLDGEPVSPGLWSVDGGAVALAGAGRDTALVLAPDSVVATAIADSQVAGES